MLDHLPPREREIVDVLYRLGPMAVADICAALPDRLSASAVRAMLTRLEAKGAVRREPGGRGFVYAPTLAGEKARRSALGGIVRTFFGGSAVSAATALLGMQGPLKPTELAELEAMVAAMRARDDTG